MKILITLFLICVINIACFGAIELKINSDLIEFESAQNLLIASGNVKIKQEDILLTSQKAIYKHNLKKINLLGNVKLIKNNLKMDCDEVEADITKSQITAKNNIVFQFGDIAAKADNALYDRKNALVTLSGNASAKQGADSLKGEEIIIFLDKEKVITKGKSKIIISPERLQ